jgi:dienelactone hydrolase
MSILDWLLVYAGLLAAVWWTVARSRYTAALEVLSVCVFLLALATLAAEGSQWQMVPWQVLGLVEVALVVLRRLRLRRAGPAQGSRAFSWQGAIERGFLLIIVVLGAWALFWAFTPTLPTPAGPYHVGSEVFHWTDTSRHEPYGKTSEYRQVVAQAWYPGEAKHGRTAPYFEERGELPGMGGIPEFVFTGDFRDIDTHGIVGAQVSRARKTWPVLVFSPALEVPRELYTGLCTQVASRGYIVMALSSPYESAVTTLADGEVVESAFPSNPSEEQLFELTKTRSADASFVLDQLGKLGTVAPHSALVGHVDLEHVGMFGHSIGGASTVQALSEDPRFRVGINLNGSLWGSQPSERLARPLLWVESGERPGPEEKKGRETLLSGLQAGGTLVAIKHSLHMSFSDEPSYMTSIGRFVWGNQGGMGRRSLETMNTLSADLVTAFAGPELGVTGGRTVTQVIEGHGALELQKQVKPASGAASGP